MDRVEFMEILFDYDIVNRKFLLQMKNDANYTTLLEKFYRDTPQTESPFYFLWNLHFASQVEVQLKNVFNYLIFNKHFYKKILCSHFLFKVSYEAN